MSQRRGKSRLVQVATEAALDAGKRVLIWKDERFLVAERHGNLTVYTQVPESEYGELDPKLFIYDELER